MIAKQTLMMSVLALLMPIVADAALPRDTPPGTAADVAGSDKEPDKPAVVEDAAADAKAAVVTAPAEAGDVPSADEAPAGNTNTVEKPASPGIVVTQPVAIPETTAIEVERMQQRTKALPRRPLTTFAAVGKSDGNVELAMIGLDYHFNCLRQLGKHGYINPYSELALSYWEGEEGHTGVTSLHEASLSLLLRYRYIRGLHAKFYPYVDVGFGMHYLTEDRIEGKELGRHWQAGSNIGIGLLFPRSRRCEFGLRLRHLSNAGTDEFNWGVNQLLARVGVRF